MAFCAFFAILAAVHIIHAMAAKTIDGYVFVFVVDMAAITGNFIVFTE